MKRFRSGFLVFILCLGIFSFAFVKANKSKNYKFIPPANFNRDDSFYIPNFPVEYTYNGVEKISIQIPPEIRTKIGSPKTKEGKINPEFLQGKIDFNEQFGIEDWKMDSYRFTQTPFGERLELEGNYKSYSGTKVSFIEHHYISPNAFQSIHLFFPTNANAKIVDQAKASLKTFNPNIN